MDELVEEVDNKLLVRIIDLPKEKKMLEEELKENARKFDAPRKRKDDVRIIMDDLKKRLEDIRKRENDVPVLEHEGREEFISTLENRIADFGILIGKLDTSVQERVGIEKDLQVQAQLNTDLKQNKHNEEARRDELEQTARNLKARKADLEQNIKALHTKRV